MTTTEDQKVREAIEQHCFAENMPAEYIDTIVAHARLEDFAEDEMLFIEGKKADEFHLLVSGRVAIEMHSPGRSQVLDTVEPCETVGWSWLVPPYKWFFDARADCHVTAVAVDAVAIRQYADENPGFGYEIMKRVAVVMLERMQAARVRLADMYGVTEP